MLEHPRPVDQVRAPERDAMEKRFDLRNPGEVKPLSFQFLFVHYPELGIGFLGLHFQVKSLIRQRTCETTKVLPLRLGSTPAQASIIKTVAFDIQQIPAQRGWLLCHGSLKEIHQIPANHLQCALN
jgi:hypothetical protein